MISQSTREPLKASEQEGGDMPRAGPQMVQRCAQAGGMQAAEQPVVLACGTLSPPEDMQVPSGDRMDVLEIMA